MESPAPDPPTIERLDDRTVRRIAAGEVVERPASVVKELVENSLDAGATRIEVAVEAGGTEGIRVRDDGVGIPADQLEAAVAEHATSKLSDIEELDRGVATLGFRGEALYTVGAVARLSVRSRPHGAAAGAEIVVDGGEVGDVAPAGCPEGTVVEVTDLFFNTPARKKFLKRRTTEFDHVNTVVTGYALANPSVAISLSHEGRETFATTGDGDLRSTVLSVYGREVAESMIDVDWVSADDDAPVERISGVVSHPETTRSTRDYLSTFVNDRYVTARTLREAVLDAYGGQLAPDRYPFVVLFADVPAGTVDVNVHPRKLEVRFDHEHAVREAVVSAVEGALLDHGLIRTAAPRGRSAPEETDVTPERQDGVDPGDDDSATDVAAPQNDVSPHDTVAGADTRHSRDDHTCTPPQENTQSSPQEHMPRTDGPAEAEAADEAEEHTDIECGSHDDPSTERDRTGATRPSPRAWQSDRPARADDERDLASSTAGSPDGTGDPLDARHGDDTTRGSRPTTQRTLAGGRTTRERPYRSLPPLRLLGQLHETYVVAEAPQGLVLIDQHAADERINYERLHRATADDPASQTLAAPVTIELTAREAALFAELAADLEDIGFRAERAGERTVRIEAVPAVFDASLDPALLRDVLSAFVGDAADATDPVGDAVDELLADLACYPSVTGNTSLTEGSVVDLLDRLDACENPYACPHGRPIIIEITGDEVADRFERDYPGHAGRRSE